MERLYRFKTHPSPYLHKSRNEKADKLKNLRHKHKKRTISNGYSPLKYQTKKLLLTLSRSSNYHHDAYVVHKQEASKHSSPVMPNNLSSGLL